MLEDHGIEFTYRDYRSEPLSEAELRQLFERLAASPRDLLRRRDRAYRELGLSGQEDDDTLIRRMSSHPTLLERPIGISGTRVVLGRPPEKLLDLARS